MEQNDLVVLVDNGVFIQGFYLFVFFLAAKCSLVIRDSYLPIIASHARVCILGFIFGFFHDCSTVEDVKCIFGHILKVMTLAM